MKTVPTNYGVVAFDGIVDNRLNENGIGYNSEKGVFTAGNNGLYHFRLGFIYQKNGYHNGYHITQSFQVEPHFGEALAVF